MDGGSDPLRVKQIDTMESLSLKDQSQLLPQWMIEMKDELECPVCLKTIMDPPVSCVKRGIACVAPVERTSKTGGNYVQSAEELLLM